MACLAETTSWLNYLIAFAPIAISCAAACIALAQFKTNDLKLKLDLYNRRFDIYQKTLNYYLNHIYNKKKSESEILNSNYEFTTAYREATFLFEAKSGVHEKLTTIKDLIANPNTDITKLENAMLALEQSLLPSLNFRKIGTRKCWFSKY